MPAALTESNRTYGRSEVAPTNHTLAIGISVRLSERQIRVAPRMDADHDLDVGSFVTHSAAAAMRYRERPGPRAG